MIHERCLQDDIEYFPKYGKALDIACGDGRNAIYLARQGYDVVGVDFSKLALERLKYFLHKETFDIETRLIDLSSEYSFTDEFDIVIINHYRLNPKLYSHIRSNVKNGGILWVNGFSRIPQDNNNITEEDILKEDDFIDLTKYKLEDKRLYQINNREFIRCIWRK